MGRRVKRTSLQAAQESSQGMQHVAVVGLANQYVSYFTTPEEYERQHYEGGSTLYGRYSSNLLKQSLTDLAARLVNGQAAPDAFPYDPNNGLTATSSPFPRGASSASSGAQPGATARLARATFGWSGGPKGQDRPLDHPFVTIRRRVGSSWQHFTDDLG